MGSFPRLYWDGGFLKIHKIWNLRELNYKSISNIWKSFVWVINPYKELWLFCILHNVWLSSDIGAWAWVWVWGLSLGLSIGSKYDPVTRSNGMCGRLSSCCENPILWAGFKVYRMQLLVLRGLTCPCCVLQLILFGELMNCCRRRRSSWNYISATVYFVKLKSKRKNMFSEWQVCYCHNLLFFKFRFWRYAASYSVYLTLYICFLRRMACCYFVYLFPQKNGLLFPQKNDLFFFLSFLHPLFSEYS